MSAAGAVGVYVCRRHIRVCLWQRQANSLRRRSRNKTNIMARRTPKPQRSLSEKSRINIVAKRKTISGPLKKKLTQSPSGTESLSGITWDSIGMTYAVTSVCDWEMMIVGFGVERNCLDVNTQF
jgi:hypothetical protein